MKLSEINLGIKAEYKIKFGDNRFDVLCKDGDLYKRTYLGLQKLTDGYSLNFIINKCDFEILWDKLEKDTKVICLYGGYHWLNRHLKEYRDGKILVYEEGRTSHTDNGNWDSFKIEDVKLY